MLLRAGADPLRGGPKGVTALHRALGQGHESVAALLLESCLQAGRRDALEARDELGRTCLDFAREQDLGPVVRRVEAAFAALCAREDSLVGEAGKADSLVAEAGKA